MMMMIDFLLGIAVGGLSIWGIMRQQVAQIEAKIAATTTRKSKKAAAAPPVKTRKIGEGPKGTPRKAKAAKKDSTPAPDPKPAPDASGEPSEPEEASEVTAEPTEKPATDAPKKPLLSLKLPEPSSAVDDSEE